MARVMGHGRQRILRDFLKRRWGSVLGEASGWWSHSLPTFKRMRRLRRRCRNQERGEGV